MAKEAKKLLNLAGDLSPRVQGFFQGNQVEIILPELLEDIKKINYILVKDWTDFDDLNNRYETLQNGISIISLSGVPDSKDFLLAGGRMVLDETWLDNKVGSILLQKVFEKAGTIHLDELFGQEFKEYKTCKISSHLRLGHYSDIISMDAFDNDFNLVSIRGFLYHVIYYYTYLKQAGLGSVPFEVEYAHNADVFVVHTHMAVKNFVADYLLDCFGEDNTTDPLKYLLKTAYRLTDNMDVTYIEKPSRLTITGVWKKTEAERVYKYNQLLLNNIRTTKQILGDLERNLTNTNVTDQDPELDTRTETIKDKPLPGNIVEMVLNPGDPNSAINQNPQKAASLIAHVVASAKEQGKKVENLTNEEFDAFVQTFPDSEFVAELLPGDKKNLLEKVQKREIAEAYEQEVQRVKDNLNKDSEHIQKVQENFAEEVAQRVSSVLDADTLNQIISSDDNEEEAKVVSGKKYDLDIESFLVPEGDREKEEAIKVGGGITEEDGKITVHDSQNEEDEDKVTVKGGITEEDGKITVHDGQSEEDEEQVRIKDITQRQKEEINNVQGSKDSELDRFGVGGTDTQDDGLQKSRSNYQEDAATFNVGSLSGSKEDKEAIRIQNVTQKSDENRHINRLPVSEQEKISAMMENAFQQVTKSGMGDGGTLDFGSMMNGMKQYLSEQGLDPELATQVLKGTEFMMQRAFENDLAPNGGSLAELSANYLNDFKKKKLHNIVGNVLDKIVVEEPEQQNLGEKNLGNYFKKKFKQGLGQSLGDYLVDEDGNPRGFVPADFLNENVQNAIQQSVQKVFQEQLHVIPGGSDKYHEMEEQVIKSLGEILPLDPEMLKQMAQQSSQVAQNYEVESIVDNIFMNASEDPLVVRDGGMSEDQAASANEVQGINSPQGFEQTAMLQKMKQFEMQNEKLKEEVNKFKIESAAKAETIKQLQTMARDAKMAHVKLSKEIPKRNQLMTESKRQELKNNIAANSNLSPEDKELLEKTIEREARLLDITKKAELELRKFQIEARQKDAKLEQELTKMNRALQSKDLVVAKAKEHIQGISKKKDEEISKLTGRINEINKKQNSAEADKTKQELAKLEKENQNLQRMVDVYKRKTSGATTDNDIQAAGTTNSLDPKQFQDQVKHLEAVKKKLEQKILSFERNNSKLSSKLKEQQTDFNRLQKERDSLKNVIKQNVVDDRNSLNEIVDSQNISQQDQAQSEQTGFSAQEKMRMQSLITDASKKNKDLENKLKMMQIKAEEAAKNAQKAKQLTAQEAMLKKEAFAANKKIQALQEKLSLMERKVDFSTQDTIGNEVIDSANLVVDNQKKLAKEKDDKIKELEKELQKALFNQFKDAKKDAKEDPVAGLKANEAKLKLQLMEANKKIQLAETKLKSMQSSLGNIENAEVPSTDNATPVLDSRIKQELVNSKNQNKALEGKIKSLEKDLNDLLLAKKDTSQDPVAQDKKANIIEQKLKKQLESSNKKVREYDSKISELEKKLERAEQQVKNDNSSTSSMTNSQIESKLKSDLLASNRKISELTQKIKNAEKKASMAEAAKAKAMEDMLRISNQSAQNQAGAGSLDQDESAKMRFELASSQRKVTSLETQLKRLNKQYQDSGSRLELAQQQAKAAQNEVANLESRYKQEILISKRQIQDYENKMKEMEKKLREISGPDSKSGPTEQVNMTMYKQMEANSKKLMQELNKAKNLTASSKSDLTKLKAENTGLQNKVKQMEREMIKAKQAIQNMQKKGGRGAA